MSGQLIALLAFAFVGACVYGMNALTTVQAEDES